MSEISVVMSVYNQSKYVGKAIESVLAQSFEDFEFIIVDGGSTDDICAVVASFTDSRIKFIQNKYDMLASLNFGLENAKGKYIAYMDGDYIMHIDRLKIQYAIMQEYENVAVCGTWTDASEKNGLQFGKRSTSIAGFVEKPLLKFIQNNFLALPTTMLRADFLKKNALKYENYPWAEDHKLWVEIAKSGGGFYVESQTLLYRQLSSEDIDTEQGKEREKSTEKITDEVLEYMIKQNKEEHPELSTIYNGFCKLQKKGLFTQNEISVFYHNLFSKNEEKLKL